MCEKFVGLIRVSTKEQEVSGLGLAAGEHEIREYVKSKGAELVALLEEVVSGGKDNLVDRPTLQKALTLCKRTGATLLIPKVDRLVRSTQVHTDIKRSGVPFRAVDMPEANEFTLDILVAVAAHERRAISIRTKAALAAYKREGKVSKRIQALYPDGVPAEVVEATAGKLGAHLGGSHLNEADREKGRALANQNKVEKARAAYEDLLPMMKELRAEGLTQQQIADRLNDEGHTTRTGKPWGQVQVKRVLDRS